MKKNSTNLVLMRSAFALLCFLMSASVYGQTLVTAPLTGTNTLGEYYNYSNGSIILSPNFSSSPGSGQSFHAYLIQADCQPLAFNPSFNRNFVITFIPRTAASTLANYTSASTCDLMANIQYLDGLGRPVQNIQVKGSPNGNDLVQAQTYDKFGRESVKYLPYASPSIDGSYKTAAFSEQSAFYGTGAGGVVTTPYPYAVTNTELSTEGRPIELGAPGASWQPGGGHTITTAYETNGANDIALWTVSSGGNGASTSSYYGYSVGVATLTSTVTTDENGHAVITYKDIEGHVVCKKVQSGASTYLATNYIYDDFGNLAYVIPPMPSGTSYPTSFTESDAVFTNFIYGYHYDGRHRVIAKKIPGKGWEAMVYNNLDKVVATQDAVQQGTQTWTFTKYDALGRAVQSGTWNNGGTAISQASLQSSVNSNTNLWESPASGGNGYTDIAWPTANITTLTLNYYDNYSTTYIPGLPSDYSAPSGSSTSTTGLLTATKTAVLNNPADMLWTVHYYDDFGRNLKSYTQHYLGGTGSLSTKNYDAITNTYDFTNELTASTREHYKNVSNTAVLQVTVYNTYTYDHAGRKTQTHEQINSGGANVLLAQSDYNEIGQLKTKHLHSISGSGFLQDINYSYNERGWLKTSNAQLFAMQLNYQDGSTPQWNGNITNQYWGTPGNLNKNVTYSYDYLNRLISGNSGDNNNENNISYDELGNIMTLNRYQAGTQIDNLAYSYSGTNRLQSITDGTSNDAGLKHGTFSYGYDGNGNMTTDNSKGLTVGYNMLNLPQTNTLTGGTISYVYDAGGRKLRKISTLGSGTATDYIDGIQYTNGTIDFIQTEEGRILNLTGTPNYEYTLADHLGNSRVIFDSSHGGSTALQTDDYYPFGMIANQPTVTSPPNHYLYNKKELQDELGQYDYGARFYDPVIARWNVIDPLAEKSRRFSPYTYGVDNPISNIDRDGMETESVHVDKYGTVLKNINDGDNHVYEHDNAKTTADVDKTYSATNTGAGGKDIGELGGKIDVSTILKNDLQRDGKIAEGLTHNQWIGKVMPGGEWDLKANQSTIFGVAWNYDETLKTQTSIDHHTMFQFNGMQENGNFTAADVGNYHAGYTGIAAGMPQRAQYNWAGTGEMVKDLTHFNFGSAGHRLNEMIFNVSPNGDQKTDFHWNTQGMVDASKAGLHP